MQTSWHLKKADEVLGLLDSDARGLSSQEAGLRLHEYGKNKLPEAKPDSLAVIFLRQFQNPLIYILLAAAAIVLFMGEIPDALIILFVLLFNAVVGTLQEGRAQNTLLALRKYAQTSITVLRDGREVIVRDEDIAPGDVMLLSEGEKIPADARVIASNSLRLDESALTGESTPVHKDIMPLVKEYLPVAEQNNMVFMGTHIVAGSGKAVVVATGIKTQLGRLASRVASLDTQMPLKKSIRRLSRAIIAAVVAINTLLFLAGWLTGKGLKEMFVTLVSLSVSIIPEGLPIVMTLILAAGVWRMSKRNALVKRLQAVEALGQAQVIAVDKTGTITKNELVVQRVFAGDALYDVTGAGYGPDGIIQLGGKAVEPQHHPDLIFAIKHAVLCTDARIMLSEEKTWIAKGDPTEAALVALSKKVGLHKDLLENEMTPVKDFPFDYLLKYRASVRRGQKGDVLMVLGASEHVLERCSKIWRDGQSHLLDAPAKEGLQQTFEKLSRQGFRVVALAVDLTPPKMITAQKARNLTFAAFFAMKDALRPEIADAILSAKAAGVRVVMITGDHAITAKAIAKEAGIYHEGDAVMGPGQLDALSDSELAQQIQNVSVFARVSPEHKLRIINAFKARKKVIAMTGDGVNDAPSLVAADLGIAMGRIGTEVAKEAADIVLLDDNFISIVSAIEEGRSIYKTIKKVILYLFSTSLGEVMVITGAIVLGWPLPILPAQIIWLNFVTDGFLDVALAMEPREKNLLSGSFQRSGAALVDRLMAGRMVLMACCMMIGTLLMFGMLFDADLAKAQTMAFAVLAVFQWFNAYNCRSERASLLKTDPFSNKYLIGATCIVIVLQLLAVYQPILQGILRTVPLTALDWLMVVAVAGLIVLVEEARKAIGRRRIYVV